MPRSEVRPKGDKAASTDLPARAQGDWDAPWPKHFMLEVRSKKGGGEGE